MDEIRKKLEAGENITKEDVLTILDNLIVRCGVTATSRILDIQEELGFDRLN